MRPLRLLLLAVVLAVALTGWALARSPVATADVAPVRFAAGPLDAGFTATFSEADVAFGTADDTDEPALHFAALLRADGGVATVDDATAFLAVERRGPRVLALAEHQAEGPGPILELLVSDDDGATFERRSVPKPSYLAIFEGWRVDGDALEVTLSLDDEVQLAEPWWRPHAALWVAAGGEPPLTSAGRYVLVSRDGGRRWRLRPP